MPGIRREPEGSYPQECATFNPYGVRVPFLEVSPFSKPHYVSHTVGDHTSILAFIEARFLATTSSSEEDADNDEDDRATTRQHLTYRDQHAHTLEDMFDFDASPLGVAGVPTVATPDFFKLGMRLPANPVRVSKIGMQSAARCARRSFFGQQAIALLLRPNSRGGLDHRGISLVAYGSCLAGTYFLQGESRKTNAAYKRTF